MTEAAPDAFAGRAPRRHSLPVFEGTASRHHANHPLWRLRLASLRPTTRLDWARVAIFTQFVGFPRSGHSLLGALIDAHPDATIAHELDAMGLFRAGLPPRRVARLIVDNAARFAQAGKWWNGYPYAVPDAPPATTPPCVVGDKKGDWAARWCDREPDLLERFLTRIARDGKRARWLLVTRAPADNIATMTLRRGGTYDRLAIAAAQEGRSRTAVLRAAQEAGDLPCTASDAMIADYRGLCGAIAAMKARINPEDWFEIPYEAFTRAPEPALLRIAAFLGITPDPDWARAAASLVTEGRSRSRDLLAWSPSQTDALAGVVRDFDFLAPHAGNSDV